MNRRELVRMLAVSPLVEFAPSVREIRRSLQLDNSIPCQIIVTVHPGVKAAERFRRAWIEGGPFEGVGEWYRDSSETRELPNHLSILPGTMMYYTATVGAAAARQQHLVGSFRREHITCIVRMRGDDEETMITVADYFATAALPELFPIIWNDVHLEALIPDSDDLGISVEEQDGFWP